MTCRAHYLGRYHEGQGHSMTYQQNRVRPITSFLEVGFYNYFTEMITILRCRVVRNILIATLKVNVTAWPFSNIVSGHNVIWNPILKLFHRNDHHIESPSREQHLGRYLEGQGHSMILQHKRVRPKTLLFKVGFYNFYDRHDHHIEMRCLYFAHCLDPVLTYKVLKLGL